MAVKPVLIALLFSSAVSFGQTDRAFHEDYILSQHQREDQSWAQKTGLPVSDVRAIRMFAGINDNTDGSRLLNLDADSLKVRHQILLVERQNGTCTRVHVVERSGDTFKEVWTLTKVPDPIFGLSGDTKSRGICKGSVNAHGTPEGGIVLEVRIQNDPFQRSVPTDTYLFQWKGDRYEFVESAK